MPDDPPPLAALLDATPALLAYWDAALHNRMASAALARWFGGDPAALPGQPYARLVGDATFALHRPYLQAALDGAPQVFEHAQPDAWGVARSASIHLVPHIAGGRVLGVMMFMHDTSAPHWRSRMQPRPAPADGALAAQEREQARARELVLESEKLRILLESRTVMLNERNNMLQLLSHEIRQPLNNALAAMQAAMHAIGELHLDAAAPAASALVRAGHVLQQVIGTLDNTLAVGTILADGGQRAGIVDTDLPTLINLVLHDVNADERARIDVQWLTRTRTVQLHAALMRLCLRNLIHNALAYSPASARVQLHILEFDEPLAIVIEVADAGPGIPPELRPTLFDKGTRGANAKFRAGAGLGLYIVRTVLDMHRGTVEALPNAPHGTVMRLTLPQGWAD